ncbi:sugar fermentation stimulation protein SfsA, partial [Candidatus Nomurabacteria bacterium]|nr:sugar fermentation stimulation protein SfsA [Candidatus Nomurabacteria bacterium]
GRDYLLSLGLTFGEIKPLGTAKHVFSHLEWEMTGYLAVAGKTADISGWVWASAEEIRLRYSVPSAFKSYLSLIP